MGLRKINELLDGLVSNLSGKHPSFHEVQRMGSTVNLEGVFTLDLEFNGVWLYEEYELRMEVNYDFPRMIPSIWELSGKIPSTYEHKFKDNSLCLGIEGEIALELGASGSLVDFLEGPVRDALYSAKYFYRYGRYPFGDRAHGCAGIFDFYKTWFDTQSETEAYKLLSSVATGKYRGHLPCPCGSDRKGRECHGPKILEAMNSVATKAFANDLSRIDEALRHEYDNAKKRTSCNLSIRSSILKSIDQLLE